MGALQDAALLSDGRLALLERGASSVVLMRADGVGADRRPLGEPVIALDVKREAQVNESIAGLNVTRIVIAHRPETIGSAQRVIEMKRGKVIYDGPPDGYFERLGLPRPAKAA